MTSFGGSLDGEKWVKVYVSNAEQHLEALGPENDLYRLSKDLQHVVLQLEKVVSDPENYAKNPQWKRALENAQLKMNKIQHDPTYKEYGVNRHAMTNAGKRLLAEAFQVNLNVSKLVLFDAVESFTVYAAAAGLHILGLADATLLEIKTARKRSNFVSGEHWARELLTEMKETLQETDESDFNYNKIRDATGFVKEFYKVAADPEMYTGGVLDQDTLNECVHKAEKEVQLYSPGNSEYTRHVKANFVTLIRQAAEKGFDVNNSKVFSSVTSMASSQSSAGYETQMGQHKARYNTFSSEK